MNFNNLTEFELAEIFWTWNNLCMKNNKGNLKDMVVDVDGELYNIKIEKMYIIIYNNYESKTFYYYDIRRISRNYRIQVERKFKLKEILK